MKMRREEKRADFMAIFGHTPNSAFLCRTIKMHCPTRQAWNSSHAARKAVAAFVALRDAEGIGRPLGSADFVAEIERRTGRRLTRQKPGRKANKGVTAGQMELGFGGWSE
jgi:hypothetical protein